MKKQIEISNVFLECEEINILSFLKSKGLKIISGNKTIRDTTKFISTWDRFEAVDEKISGMPCYQLTLEKDSFNNRIISQVTLVRYEKEEVVKEVD